MSNSRKDFWKQKSYKGVPQMATLDIGKVFGLIYGTLKFFIDQIHYNKILAFWEFSNNAFFDLVAFLCELVFGGGNVGEGFPYSRTD